MLKRWFESVFAAEEVNTGRQTEADIAKGILVLCLSAVHCTIKCTDDAGMATGDSLASVIAAVCFLRLWHFAGKIFPARLLALLRCASRNITRVYCIHWVFVVWVTYVLFPLLRGTPKRPMWEVLIVSTVIIALSLALAELWSRKLRKKIFGRKNHAAA